MPRPLLVHVAGLTEADRLRLYGLVDAVSDLLVASDTKQWEVEIVLGALVLMTFEDGERQDVFARWVAAIGAALDIAVVTGRVVADGPPPSTRTH